MIMVSVEDARAVAGQDFQGAQAQNKMPLDGHDEVVEVCFFPICQRQ